MAMVVKNNMSAVNTLNTLNKNQSALGKSLQKVSSGMKINSAQDDASGYGISERMRTMIRSLDQANENTQNGSSLMKVAEGAVGKTVEILRTLKNKAIQSATDTNTDDDRKTIQKEIDQLIDQIDENALITFNGKYLLDGSRTQAGSATFTAMTNQKLDTNTDGSTKIVDLKNRKGESLEIIATDQVTASYVKNGKTYTTTFAVGNNRLEDIFYNLNTLGDTPAFGPANLTKNTMTVGDAQTLITANCAASSDLTVVLTGEETDTTKINNWTNSAVAMARGGEVGASRSEQIASMSVATKDLDSALTAYFKELYLKTTNGGGNISAGLTFNIFKEDGSVSAKTYIFETEHAGVAETSLYDADRETFNQMKSDLLDSVYNLLRAGTTGTDSDTSIATNAARAAVQGTGDLTAFSDTACTDVALFASSGGGANKNLSDAVEKALSFAVLAGNVKISNATTDSAQVDLYSNALASPGFISNTTAAATAKGGSDSSDDVATQEFTNSNTDKVTYKSIKQGDGTEEGAKNVTLGDDSDMTTTMNYATAFAISRLANPVNSGINIGLNPADAMVKTADGTTGLTVTAMNDSIGGQISGLTIKIADAQAQSRTAINEVLDAFGTTIFASSKSEDLTLKIHTGAAAGQAISIGLSDMRASALGLKGNDSEKVSVVTQHKANAAINVFDNALQKALDIQTTIGAIEARLEYTSDNLTTSSENVQAAESTIRDADMAKEMTNYTKNNVLLQAAQSMLAQANQNSSAVLSLLQ